MKNIVGTVCTFLLAGALCIPAFGKTEEAGGRKQALLLIDAGLEKSPFQESDFDTSGEIRMTTEHKTYGKDIETITCFIENRSEQYYSYGLDWQLEIERNGIWYQMPLYWDIDAIGLGLSPGKTNSEEFRISKSGYQLEDGHYRLIKSIDLRLGQGSYLFNNYQAEFWLGDSSYTAETPFGFRPLETLSQTYSAAEAQTNGELVLTKDGIKNTEAIDVFIQKVALRAPAMLRISDFTKEVPVVTDIIYTGEYEDFFRYQQMKIHKTGNQIKEERIFSFITTDGAVIYLSNYVDDTYQKNGQSRDYIAVLYDRKDCPLVKSVETVEQIEKKKLSGNSTIYRTYAPDASADVILSDTPLEYGYENRRFGRMKTVSDPKNIAKEIINVRWISNSRFQVTCSTTTNKVYIFVMDLKDGIIEDGYQIP